MQAAQRIVKLSDNVENRKLLLIFLVLATVALLFFGGVTCYAGILRRKPRVKRRFVGVTPLTSRPQIPGNQCEITIENCCNMNICETVSEISHTK